MVSESGGGHEHEGGKARDPIRETGEEPGNLATALEVLIGILVAPRGIEADVDDDNEIQRDERVIETVDGIEDGLVQSGKRRDRREVRRKEERVCGCRRSRRSRGRDGCRELANPVGLIWRKSR